MPKSFENNLKPLFLEIFDGLDVGQDKIDALYSSLCTAYNEDGRYYHTLEHLNDLAQEFEKHRNLFGDDTRAILIALFYHDVVYNCVPGQDEQDSAAVMREELSGIIDQTMLDRASAIILYTASHQAPDNDHAARLFLDMDMSILGSKTEKYARYLTQVTQEYCTAYDISEAEFQQKRAELFLKPTIENGRKIFTTNEYEPLETLAHANISWELNRNTESAPSAPQP